MGLYSRRIDTTQRVAAVFSPVIGIQTFVFDAAYAIVQSAVIKVLVSLLQKFTGRDGANIR